MIQLGVMPLPQFVRLHPEATVTPDELTTLKAYLAPWTPAPAQSGNPSAGNVLEPASPATVQPEFNGFSFDPNYKSWRPISTTDRGDNNTFRFVLGNDVAVQAAQSGNISPWPDGTRFAKIAWHQETSADGLVHPGKFVQVELMLKDATRYKDTNGWGWGRWRGRDLKPYGKDARFVNECTGCHLPVRGNDYVYTLPITMVAISRKEVLNSRAAALPSGLPYQPLNWRAITMYVDPRNHTMATLYGNDLATQAAHGRGDDGSKRSTYPFGAVLALITWAQRDDPHWFGGRFPDTPQSVEFVQFPPGQPSGYRRFAGAGLVEDRSAAGISAERIAFIQALPPTQLP